MLTSPWSIPWCPAGSRTLLRRVSSIPTSRAFIVLCHPLMCPVSLPSPPLCPAPCPLACLQLPAELHFPCLVLLSSPLSTLPQLHHIMVPVLVPALTLVPVHNPAVYPVLSRVFYPNYAYIHGFPVLYAMLATLLFPTQC